METVFRNLGWLLASRGVNAVLSLVYLALATRILGLESFGHFALIVVLAQGAAGIVSFNGWQAVVRWGVEAGEAQAATGFALALDLVSIVFGAAFSMFLVWLAFAWLPLPKELAWPAYGLCLATICAIRSTPTGVLRLYGRYDLASIADAALPVARTVGAIGAAVFCPDVACFLIGWAVAELCCAVTFWYLAYRYIAIRRSDISLTVFPSRHKDAWRFVLGTSLSRTLAVFSKQFVLLLVGAIGGAAMAGGYRVASQLGQALVQLGEALSRAIYPEFVKAQSAANLLSEKMTLLSLMTGAVALVASYFGGKWAIVWLAGPDFAFAHMAMIILSLAGVLELLSANWETLIVSRRNAMVPFLIRVFPMVLAFALLTPFISLWGIEGAAFSILLASLLSGLGFLLSTRFKFALQTV